MLKDFISLFFPTHCAGCGSSLHSENKALCVRCITHLPLTKYNLNNQNPTAQKFWGKIPIHSAISLLHFRKGGVTQQLMHELKYKNNEWVGFYLGKLLGRKMSEDNIASFDFIVPVPLHKKKRKKRGYNQCDSIARGISEVLNVPIENSVLMRITNNKSQTGKGLFQRWQNVETIFSITSNDRFREKHILLVDDVITTGATLESCIHQLYQSEGVKISIATLAIAE